METYKMMIQLAGIDELLQGGSDDDTELVLGELWTMLKKNPADPLHLSDIIPHALLEIGDEQKCYDFIKWCALHGPKSPSANPKSPFFDLKSADVFESPDRLIQSGLSLSHLVALTLLKLRLYLDLEAISEQDFDTSMGYDDHSPSIDRPLGAIVEDIFESATEPRNVTALTERMRKQYLNLCKQVNAANPHFWEALTTEEPRSTDGARGPGSRDEADLVLYHCRRAWDRSEDALVMIETDTAQFTRLYARQATVKKADYLEKRRGTGKAFPIEVVCSESPQHASLEDILAAIKTDTKRGRMTVGKDNKLVLWTDGACINNGQENPRGGWAVWIGARDPNTGCKAISGRLENRGPFGDRSPATSNRAELRAVIAALRLSNWKEEGFRTIVIATDSTYVANGATAWTRNWVKNGWKLSSGADVKNKDLWELLLGEVEKQKDQGVVVNLLHIPRENNAEADKEAKNAARTKQDKAKFADITLSPTETQFAKGTSVEGASTQKQSVLAVCLASESMFRDLCGSFITGFPPEAPLNPVYNPESALDCLNGPSPPSMILITDAMIARHRQVWERIIDHMRDGARVVFAGSFSTMVTTDEFKRLFTTLGLPWERGSYFRADAVLQAGVVDTHLTEKLPSTLCDKTAFVKNVRQSDCWYVDPDAPGEAAVAFTKIESGRLGYIGCVNNLSESVQVAEAMFGLS